MLGPMPAIPVQRLKRPHAGGVVEINIWCVPEPVPPCSHHYKHWLAYIVGGRRVVGFDNERGKGDHRHDNGRETAYAFVDVGTLVADFWRAVAEQGGGT